MLRLLKGIFGTAEKYAFQDFEAMPVGELTGTVDIPGAVERGGCTFEPATFGSRE